MVNEFTSDRRSVLQSLAGLALVGGAGVDAVAASGRREAFEPRGFASVDGAAEAVASEDGRTAYVAFSTGFASVDISDPTSPTVLATRTDTGISGILDVKEEGDRVAVVGPGNRAGATNGMGLYDVSDPANPQRLALFETDYSIHNAYLTEDTAYLIDNGSAEIVMVDVTNDDPREVARWGLDGASILHDHWVQDGVAYLNFWDDGTAMLDVSDPANPSPIGKVREGSRRGGNNDHYVTVNDDASIIGIGKEQLGARSNLGVELWDISDKRNTEFLAEIEPPAEPAGEERTSHNFDIQGDYLYTSWYRGGIRVHDISDPANPEQIASWRGDGTSMWTAEVAVPGETVVASDEAVSGGNGRLYTFPDPATRSDEPPTARIDVSPATPTVGEAVTFDGTGSSDPDGTVESYEWTLDGEVVSAQPSDSFSFDEAGEYTAGLTVTDDDGNTDSTSATLTVEAAPNEGPVARIDVSPADPEVGEEVTFDGTGSSDPDGTVEAYEWTLDGEVVSTEPSDTVTFDEAGEYAAGLTVTDDDGRTDTAEATLTVGASNAGPTARIGVSPSDPTVGDEVTFDGTDSFDRDGTIEAYEWTLDGEVVSTQPSDAFTFDEAGDYTAGLTVTDNDGASDTAEATLTVADDGTGECGAETDGGSASGWLGWWESGDTYSYSTRTADPCELTVELDGSRGNDFDLYLTYDGRTPTTDDFDEAARSPDAAERITAGLDGATEVGILVDRYSGWGGYELSVEESGR